MPTPRCPVPRGNSAQSTSEGRIPEPGPRPWGLEGLRAYRARVQLLRLQLISVVISHVMRIVLLHTILSCPALVLFQYHTVPSRAAPRRAAPRHVIHVLCVALEYGFNVLLSIESIA